MAPALSHAGASPVVTRSPLQLLQYLDVVLVVLATPVALALGAPAFGLLIAGGAWLVQRVLAHVDRRWIARKRERRGPGSGSTSPRHSGGSGCWWARSSSRASSAGAPMGWRRR